MGPENCRNIPYSPEKAMLFAGHSPWQIGGPSPYRHLKTEFVTLTICLETISQTPNNKDIPAKTGVKVVLKLDIEAHSDKPFDSILERTVKENGTVLGIRGEGFMEEG